MSSNASTVEMISDVLGHELEITAGDLRPAWDAFTAALDESDDDASFLASAIRLKALSLIALNRVRDYTDTSELITIATPAGVTNVLEHLDERADSPAGLPLATILVRRLGIVRPRKRASLGNGLDAAPKDPTAEQWTETIENCIAVAALMISGIESTAEHPEWTPETIATAIDEGDLDSWRSILNAIGGDPWSPVAQHLNQALTQAKDKGAATALRQALSAIRTRVEREEHQDIASRVTEYVANAGITQRAFAARIGTSPSRLSTYANGSVTPSAAMMLRIAKSSVRLSAERP